MAGQICFGRNYKLDPSIEKSWRDLCEALKKFGLSGIDADAWFCEQRIRFGDTSYDFSDARKWAKCIQTGEYD